MSIERQSSMLRCTDRVDGLWGAVAVRSLTVCAVFLCLCLAVARVQAQEASQGPTRNTTSTLAGSDQRSIEVALEQQQSAWNEGNLDKFMSYYWQSDQLTFASGGKLTRGWTATRDNYRKKYQNKEAMGKLAFGNLEYASLGQDAALVLGTWQLTGKANGEDVGGNFSLVWQRIEGRWLIVHDHTSVLK